MRPALLGCKGEEDPPFEEGETRVRDRDNSRSEVKREVLSFVFVSSSPEESRDVSTRGRFCLMDNF